MRIASQKFSRPRRWLYAACFALIPIKLFAVTAARNFRYRAYLPHFLKTIPLLMIGLYAWVFGELVAYIRPQYPDRKSSR
jgi:hypothetical protein